MPQFNEGNINSYLVPSGSLTGSLSNSGTLTGQIAIGSGSGTTDYNDLTNKPSINSVTLSGNKTTADLNISYNDLDDKPALATVATTGDYDDLTDKPAIPSALNDLSDVNINNPYQTDVLSYNESTSKWINHPVSLTVEGLSNVALSTPYAGEVLKISSTSGGVPIWRSSHVNYSEINNTPTLATVATSGDYDDLTNKPTIPDPQVNSDWNASSGVAEILNKPALATVATSGSYNDLTDKPVEATSISVTASSDMPAGFPVPDVCRRGKVVIARFSINMPARTYLTTETIWNFSKKPVIVTNFILTNVNGETIPMLIHSTDGKIRFSTQRTLNAASYFLGELVYLTDED
jgi:hypothetical protein